MNDLLNNMMGQSKRAWAGGYDGEKLRSVSGCSAGTITYCSAAAPLRQIPQILRRRTL